jgi:hypothetical protein
VCVCVRGGDHAPPPGTSPVLVLWLVPLARLRSIALSDVHRMGRGLTLWLPSLHAGQQQPPRWYKRAWIAHVP